MTYTIKTLAAGNSWKHPIHCPQERQQGSSIQHGQLKAPPNPTARSSNFTSTSHAPLFHLSKSSVRCFVIEATRNTQVDWQTDQGYQGPECI